MFICYFRDIKLATKNSSGTKHIMLNLVNNQTYKCISIVFEIICCYIDVKSGY